MAGIMGLFASELDEFVAYYDNQFWDASFHTKLTNRAAALLELFLHGFMQERKEMEAAQE